jgi:N-acetylmuramoyl-L-alanine amidase
MRKGPSRSPYVLALALGIAALGGALATGTVVLSARAVAPAPEHLTAPRQYVVAIMPGHGGVDPGAISPFNGLKEKNVTLSLGLDLRQDLEADGVKVAMTRTTDTDVSISQAESIAVRSHAQVLISLWVNDWTDGSLEGSTVFIPYQRDQSLAQKLDTGIASAIGPLGMADRGIQLLPQLWVHAPMPAVTIEVGFMSNRQDSQLLAEPSFRARVADGLAGGIVAFAPQIPKIETRLLAYRRAEAKVVAAQRAAAAQGRSARQLQRWLPLLLILDALLALALYREAIWRKLPHRAPAFGGFGVAAASLRSGSAGSALGGAWHRVTGARKRSRTTERRGSPAGRRSPGTRPRRPPREWKGRAGALHPRRVTEMVQPSDRGGGRRRRSVYDDFSF